MVVEFWVIRVYEDYSVIIRVIRVIRVISYRRACTDSIPMPRKSVVGSSPCASQLVIGFVLGWWLVVGGVGGCCWLGWFCVN